MIRTILLSLFVVSGHAYAQQDKVIYVKDWRSANPEYEDTEFGEYMYNEPSTATRVEMLRMLSKDSPSITVFLNAVSMGVHLEDALQAATRFQDTKARDFASSAVSLLPVLSQSPDYEYSTYDLDDLEYEIDEYQRQHLNDKEYPSLEKYPYSVERVAEKFFKDRLILAPYPDWFEGQYHFLASAEELNELQQLHSSMIWYQGDTEEAYASRQIRPIFVSLYENDGTILVDGKDRIEKALAADSNARLPVVFIFNRQNERSISQLAEQGYPLTMLGVQQAYLRESIMLTPAPEWELGEYNFMADVEEFYRIFDIPDEEYFEPESWQRILDQARKYAESKRSLLVVIVRGGSNEDNETLDTANLSQEFLITAQLTAQWDDPRSEQPYGRTDEATENQESMVDLTLDRITAQGMVFNRPELIAGLNAIGVKKVPIAFYYVDSARFRPFSGSPRALKKLANSVGTPPSTFGGGGFGDPPTCASPPCQMEPQ